MNTESPISGFVVYRSNKCIEFDPSYAVVIFDATEPYRWADWILLVSDFSEMSHFGGIAYSLKEKVHALGATFSPERLQAEALARASGHLRNQVQKKDQLLFNNLYRSGTTFLEFVPVDDSERTLFEITAFGAPEEAKKLQAYIEAVNTKQHSEAFKNKVLKGIRFAGEVPPSEDRGLCD